MATIGGKIFHAAPFKNRRNGRPYPPLGRFSIRLLAIILLYTPVVVNRAAMAADGRAIQWTGLTFKTSRLLISMTSTIHLGPPARMAKGSPNPAGPGFTDCAFTGRDVRVLRVASTIRGMPLLVGQTTAAVWFDAADGRVFQRVRRRNGSDPWVKTYCWTATGIRRQKIQPDNRDERPKDPVNWTRRTRAFYPFPDQGAGCAFVSDPALIFYMLSTGDTRELQTPFTLCVFGKKQLHRLTVRRVPPLPVDLSIQIHSPGGTVVVDERLDPLVFSVVAEAAVVDNPDPEAFSLFGLEKNILISMDAARRLPVRISGTIPHMGDLVLDLTRVERR